MKWASLPRLILRWVWKFKKKHNSFSKKNPYYFDLPDGESRLCRLSRREAPESSAILPGSATSPPSRPASEEIYSHLSGYFRSAGPSSSGTHSPALSADWLLDPDYSTAIIIATAISVKFAAAIIGATVAAAASSQIFLHQFSRLDLW